MKLGTFGDWQIGGGWLGWELTALQGLLRVNLRSTSYQHEYEPLPDNQRPRRFVLCTTQR